MDSEFIIEPCPHCGCYILIDKRELNCRIFRHGAYKANIHQIPPHEIKVVCDALARDEQIFGCGKPFRVQERADGGYEFVVCDYI